MNRPTGFHVRHDLQPDLTSELFILLRAFPDGQTQKQLRQAAQERGYGLSKRKDYNKLFRSLADLDLLSSQREPYSLNDVGNIIATMITFYPHLLPEFIHFLYYTWWDKDNTKRFSWSYRTVCDTLWRTSPCAVDRNRLVNLVTQEAIQRFKQGGVSFSTSSVAGILNWVEKLQPSCLAWQEKQQMFQRRAYCSVEIFALALNHIYQIEKSDDTFVILNSQLRERVCQICLINPEIFDEMLEQSESAFANLHIRRERGERFAMIDFSWANLLEMDV